MRRRLQGAKRSLRQRFEPHPVGPRVRRQGQPQTRSKGCGGEQVTTTWDREEHWRELRTTEDPRPQRGPPGTPPVGQGAKRSLRQRFEAQPKGEKAQHPRPVAGAPNQHLTHMVTPSRRAVTTRRNSPKGKGKTH